MGLHQNRAGQDEQSGGVGEDADDVGAAFDLFVEPFQRIGRPDLLPVRNREIGEGGDVGVLRVAEGGDDGVIRC